MPADPIIVWFRQDLRIADNPALVAAVDAGAPVLPVYVLDDATSSDWRMGGASRWWLHHALASLADDLKGINSTLILRQGNSSDVLDQLIDETGAQSVFWNRCYEPDAISRDKALKAGLLDRGIEARSFNASLLFEPWTIETKTGGPYRVFSPFWRACMGKTAGLEHAYAKPKNLQAPASWPASDTLSDWSLTPTSPDWAEGFSKMWQPGTKGALDRLSRFLDDTINDYPDARDCPGVDGTSGLSPHLHFGDIGPRQVYWAARDAADDGRATDKAVKKFVAELGWREFSYHLLYHFPAIPTDNFQDKFDDFPWRQDDDGLRAWQRGMTGYPMVDAGMRQLWQTGWMHNRVRMIVASFLVKHLMIHWHEGEKWFWDTLVDADLANNAASWQWVAGSGADAAPYFRIFNPITQGQKFDANGDYIRRYVPELSKLPDKYIHSPWTAPEEVLDEAGINLGTDYPDPVVDHSDARTRALDGYQEIRKAG
ncbi:deoxyribodipyrimidine photo-lyase [Pyruvatibacter sp.]|uniref:cryptochrome/photolyase family protein n=1 Tax=Pyruvatibacter sp. TaxID=1981328 RepID=UPI0032ECAFD6